MSNVASVIRAGCKKGKTNDHVSKYDELKGFERAKVKSIVECSQMFKRGKEEKRLHTSCFFETNLLTNVASVIRAGCKHVLGPLHFI